MTSAAGLVWKQIALLLRFHDSVDPLLLKVYELDKYAV